MKKQMTAFGILIIFLIAGFSGCTSSDSDSDEGLIDWFLDDEDNGEGKECAVYCYITVVDQRYENAPWVYEQVPELSIYATIECDNQFIDKDLSGGVKNRIDNGYVGLVYMNQYTNFSDAILKVSFFNIGLDDYMHLGTRFLSYNVASNGGTNSRYDWVEEFFV